MNNPYLDLTEELNRGRRAKIWPEVQRQIEGLSLPEAHRLVVSRAEGVLPFEPAKGADS